VSQCGYSLDYRAEVGKLLQDSPAQPDGEMGSEWQTACHGVKDAAKKVLGYKTKRNHKGWYDEKCKNALIYVMKSELECYREQQERPSKTTEQLVEKRTISVAERGRSRKKK
jgi:hypothetical protein